jgi:hypothetical protein
MVNMRASRNNDFHAANSLLSSQTTSDYLVADENNQGSRDNERRSPNRTSQEPQQKSQSRAG